MKTVGLLHDGDGTAHALTNGMSSLKLEDRDSSESAALLRSAVIGTPNEQSMSPVPILDYDSSSTSNFTKGESTMLESDVLPDLESLPMLMDYILELLKSPNVRLRLSATNKLKTVLISLAHEISIEQFQSFNHKLDNKIYQMVHSKDVRSQIAGVLSVDCLIWYYSQTEELPNYTTKLAGYLKVLIPSKNLDLMKQAIEILGKLAIPTSSITSEFLQHEVKNCIEWLTTSPESKFSTQTQELRKHASLQIITVLSKNSPTVLYPYINSILDNIWRALRDPDNLMRFDAAKVVGCCLRIISKRDESACKEWIIHLMQGCAFGLTLKTTDAIHATLLVYHELLELDSECLNDFFDDIYYVTMSFKDHRSPLIREEICSIVSLLASLNPVMFSNLYLDKVMNHFLDLLQNITTYNISNKERSHIFISIGDIADNVGEMMFEFLEPTLITLKESLRTRYRTRKDYEEGVFYCIGKLSSAIREDLQKYLEGGLLKLILECPLSDHMQKTLSILSANTPDYAKHIDKELLDLLCIHLSGDHFIEPGTPIKGKPFSPNAARVWRNQNVYHQIGIANDDLNDAQILIQTLKIFRETKFKVVLTEFVKNVIIYYIEHENQLVRKLAALTSCEIFINDSICKETSLNSLNTVSEVLEKLLTVAVTDLNPEIRLEILKHLSSPFDSHLAKPENLQLLFTALNDELIAIQIEAMKIIGRLVTVNPAYVIPSLRNYLLSLITELKYPNFSTRKDEAATLLCTLIQSSKNVTKPYIEPILNVLLPKLDDNSSTVASIALKAIGALAVVGGEDMKQNNSTLFPLMIKTLQDQSNSFKRDAALKSLGQLAASSGYVIRPFLDYPDLLSVLIGILRAESAQNIRRETVRLIGILGALDPHKQRDVEVNLKTKLAVEQNQPPIDVALLMQGNSPSNDDYYPTVVIVSLMKILKDPSLSSYHTSAVQAIMQIFQIMGLKCISFLDKIIPGIISVMHMCPSNLLDFYFQQLCQLTVIMKQHIRPYVDEIYDAIIEFFRFENLQVTILSVINSLCYALKGEFKRFIPLTLNLLLGVLEKDRSAGRENSIRVLQSFVIFDTNLELYAHTILPSILKLTEFSTGHLRKAAIITVGKLAKCINLSEMASRIVHSLARVLYVNDDELREVTLNTLSLLLLRLKRNYIIFVPVVNRILVDCSIKHAIYDDLVTKLLNGEALPNTIILEDDTEQKQLSLSNIAETTDKKLPINQNGLKSVWDCSQLRTKEDWQDWIRRLSIQFLKESPSPALRTCANLASIYHPLARELFNASFSSLWSELYTQYQESLIGSLCSALSSPQNPPEIHQVLLNLIEFMEHDDKPLPIPINTLGQYAERCHAYAKALHYKEVKFIKEPVSSTIESLISINNQLHQTDAAIGILKHAQQHHSYQLKETWYEKLQRWDDALDSYTKRAEAGDNSIEVTVGRMRSLHALGEYETLSQLAENKWKTSNLQVRKKIAPLAAGAAWGLGEWDEIEKYISVMKENSPDKEFFDAVLCLHRNRFDEAEKHIFAARDLLVTEISALINESYTRAYGVVVRTQIIAELEEIIDYKKASHNSAKRTHYRNLWDQRLLGCQKNVDIWQRILRVRSLVVKPKQDMHIWIKFANLCRKSGRMSLAQKALYSLLEDGSDPNQPNTAKAPPPVVYAQLKYLWATSSHEEVLHHLIGFTSRMAHDLGLDPSNMIAQSVPQNATVAPQHIETYTKLLARCFLKQGEWRVAIQPNWRVQNPDAILGSYLLATHFDKNWYKAWHNWALANFEVISMLTSKNKNEDTNGAQVNGDWRIENSIMGTDYFSNDESKFSPEIIQRHVVPAIKGFFHSISLLKASSLQDNLRLLTLWFTFGGVEEANKAMHDGFGMIKIDNWLEVLPQLISRIHQPNPVVSKALLSLLSDLGKAHPQALIYPLTVAIKSESVSRQKAALSIIEKMRIHSPILVDQAELVSHELIRLAVLWHELWYEGLEDASRQFFGEHNTEKMFATLEPLHELLNCEPETLREATFKKSFGRDLNDAYEWVLNYKRTKDVSNLNQAWDIYYNVFRRISRQLPQLQSLELQYVSPKLLAAHDLELAVPGTYSATKNVIKISYFEPTLTVISSKQRPRKIWIHGSDGVEYQYVLKGHEDIRQDNLVMQLFGLVNTLLRNDSECFQRHLDIQQYPAIPLSPKSGLLGWVPNSDTFHVLISEHRDAKKIPLNIEHWVMLQMAPDFDNLTLLQKIEVFTYALDSTKGQDLYKILWLKSRSSEAWLDRRTTYTRSLAVMSMVGYILGLGDRHPSNLMLDRTTGKVIHIDFGDCFEAAILREKFPEKVPFRLTRMLTFAMEVSGIEGSFRITCEHVMRVLRANKESLMAMLEAFAFDPLIHWGFDLPPQKITEMTGIQLQLSNTNELLRRGAITLEQANKMEKEQQAEIKNARALLVLRRIINKLTGNDFKRCKDLGINEQVDKLIQQATSVENLCQHYIGWCPFW
ncbi:Serine/threonine-protein kinase TOR1 [Nakaseomyces glabratus]|nr:Serine/threonine-protein kinase TOR1 [Nakaseomyces glabratus]KTB22308.1 Serine/threonine-protein kinase TOR1 [Nakaseomyces glabratus]